MWQPCSKHVACYQLINAHSSPVRFCHYPHFTGEETKAKRGSVTRPQSHNQKVSAAGLDPRGLAAECTLLPPAKLQSIRHSTLKRLPCFAHPAAARGLVRCSPVLPQIFPLKPALAYSLHLLTFQHSISPLGLQSPAPLRCQDLSIAPRGSALPLKSSPLFLESGQGVSVPLPPGVLCLPISSSVLLLKPKGLKCYKDGNDTFGLTSVSMRHSFPTLLGVVGPWEPSPALEVKFCFYLFHILGFHVKFHLNRGPIFKTV